MGKSHAESTGSGHVTEDATYKHVDAEIPCQAMTRCSERERVTAKAEYGHPLSSMGDWFQDPRKHPRGSMFCGKTLYAKWPPKPKEPRGPRTKQTSPASQFKVFLIGNFLTETHSSMAAGQNGSPHRSLPGPPVLHPFRNGLRTPKGIQGCWRERRGPDAGGALPPRKGLMVEEGLTVARD